MVGESRDWGAVCPWSHGRGGDERAGEDGDRLSVAGALYAPVAPNLPTLAG